MKSNYRLHVCYVCIQGVSWFCKSVFQWNVCNHTTGPGPIRLLSQCKSNIRNIHWPLWACSQEPLWGSRCSGSDWVAPSPPSHPLGPVAALEIRMTERSIQSLVFNNNNNNLKNHNHWLPHVSLELLLLRSVSVSFQKTGRNIYIIYLYTTLSINEPWEKDIKCYDTLHSSINKLQFVYTISEKIFTIFTSLSHKIQVKLQARQD